MFAFSWLRHWENIRSYLCYLLSDYQHRAGKLASLLVGCWWGSKYDPPVVIKTTAHNTKRQAGNINSQVRKKKPTDSVGHRCTGLAPRCSLNGGEGSGGGLGCHATLKKKMWLQRRKCFCPTVCPRQPENCAQQTRLGNCQQDVVIDKAPADSGPKPEDIARGEGKTEVWYTACILNSYIMIYDLRTTHAGFPTLRGSQ